ncbi:hypothetical protein BRSPCE3_17860 [Bradyrhizobium sp. Ce-3]|nr:hypothetical protein BRSPCE3_17860 [Bradyrhizobium sp. Ce-3]
MCFVEILLAVGRTSACGITSLTTAPHEYKSCTKCEAQRVKPRYRAAMATMNSAVAASEAMVRTWFQKVQSVR